mgnify:CR=1 FL=1
MLDELFFWLLHRYTRNFTSTFQDQFAVGRNVNVMYPQGAEHGGAKKVDFHASLALEYAVTFAVVFGVCTACLAMSMMVLLCKTKQKIKHLQDQLKSRDCETMAVALTEGTRDSK